MAPNAQPAVTWGRRVWTAIGIILLGIGAVFAASQVSVILVAVILALFPAAVLEPVASRLRSTRLPNALTAVALLLALFAVIAGLLTFITAALVEQWEELADSMVSGLEELDQAITWDALPGDFTGLGDLATQAGSALMEGGGLAAGAETVTSAATGLVAVALFFYLKDGPRIWRGLLEFVPARHQQRTDLVAVQAFWTVGAYFRAQLLIALVDAVLIGIGLWILGIPLVLPLAVLIFIGGLFPIVGAVVTGAIAVAVALADQGLVVALIALAIVVGVQQLESNLLQPVIQRRVIFLHPLVIILAITAGSILMGVLGAFLAVPVAAVIARIVDNVRGRPFPAGPGSVSRNEKDHEKEDEKDDGAGDHAQQKTTAGVTRAHPE